MKLSTWNVNGVRAREAQVLEFISKESPDLLCLQEIKASPEHVPLALSSMEGYWCCWHGHKGYSGVGLHVRKAVCPVSPTFTHPEFDHENRIVTVQLGKVVVASVYVPNGGKDFPAKLKFWEAMIAYVRGLHAQGRLVVILGDLNIARLPMDIHPKLQNPEQIGQTPQERALFETLLSQGLVDLSRKYEPDNDRLFTWWAPWRNQRERNIGWRLDYVLCSDALAQSSQSCAATREFGTSDHGPVSAVFEDRDWWKGVAIAPGAPAKSPEKSAPSKQLTLGWD